MSTQIKTNRSSVRREPVALALALAPMALGLAMPDKVIPGRAQSASIPTAQAASVQPSTAVPAARTENSRCVLTRSSLSSRGSEESVLPSRSGAWSRVIVTLDGAPDAARISSLRALGADPYRSLPLIHAVAARVPARSLPALRRLPCVRQVSPDLVTHKCDEFTVGSSGADVAMQQFGVTGTGVGIAVVDSGVHPHRDLANQGDGGTRILASVNFAEDNPTSDDLCGHGTYVAGVAAGNGAASTGQPYFRTFYGVARQANIVNVRVLDSAGSGTVSDAIAGIQWVVNNRSRYNIRVMNLSLGHPVGESYTTDPLCQAVEAAWKSGIVVVCAAGNGGRLNANPASGMSNGGYGTAYGTIQSPANDPYVITVGAMKSTDGSRQDDTIATYSSRGPSRLDFVLKPDIVAPGNQVISLEVNNSYLDAAYASTNEVPTSAYRTNGNDKSSNKYFRLSGTSVSAPVVSGAAALLLQRDPSLTPDTVKARLMLTADKWGADPLTYGAGYLNIPAALASTARATGYATSPTLSRDDAGNINIVGGSQVIWGVGTAQVIWGTQAIWGTNTLASSQAIWGLNVWSDQAIWGTSSAAVDLSSTAVGGE